MAGHVEYEWSPSLEHCAFMDLETQSLCNLRTTGAKRYAGDPSTRIACACMLLDGIMYCWIPEDVTPLQWELNTSNLLEDYEVEARTYVGPMPEVFKSDRIFVGHNAVNFDAPVWANCTSLDATWFDTLPVARAAGYPGKLDELGKRLIQKGKDETGAQLIQLLSIAKVKGGQVVYPVGTPHVWRLFLRYCAIDVLLTRLVYDAVRPFVEPKALALDRVINERGIPIDRPYVEKLAKLYVENERKLGGRMEELANGVNPRSPKQVHAWLLERGIKVPSLERKTLEAFFVAPEVYHSGDDDNELSAALELLKLRQSVVRTGTGKIDAILTNVDPDNRIREQTIYCGAHTGRFTGRELQPHNFPRGTKGVNLEKLIGTTDLSEVEAEAARLNCSTGDVLGTMLRPMIGGTPLLIADYGAIEARGVAWVAGDRALLEAFGDPRRDVYLDFAERIYGRRPAKNSVERFVAKETVLGAGYQMGAAKFAVRCEMNGINLATAGTTAQQLIKLYRETFSSVPRVWNNYQDAATSAIKNVGQEFVAGRCTFVVRNGALFLRLPSGRFIVYHRPRIEMLIPAWAAMAGQSIRVPTIVFDHPRGHPGFLYGGRITENVVQALSRDILVDGMCKLEENDFHVVMHVHDEGICTDPPERLEEFCKLMSVPPSWASDFPLLVEGFSGTHYTKEPMGGNKCTAFRGEAL